MPNPTWTLPGTSYAQPELTPISSSTFSATGASMTVSLAAAAGKLTYIEGFDLTAGNPTAAGNASIAVTGTVNPLYFNCPVQANDTVSGSSILSARFPPQPASASNTAITLTSSSFPLGATVATLTAYGFTTPLAAGQT